MMTPYLDSTRSAAAVPGKPIVTGRDAGAHTDSRPEGGESPRYLIYAHDTYGLGHYRRCLKIARHLVSHDATCSVLLVTGSPLADRYAMPVGVDFVKLPAVVKVGSDEYRSRSLGLSIEGIGQLRADIIRAAAVSFSPHAVLVDHAPLGLRDEARPMLESQRIGPNRPLMVLGLRDIIDEPSAVISRWRANDTFRSIENYYDQVLVYGSSSVFDPVLSYEFPPSLSRITTFVGFITESGAIPQLQPLHNRRPTVLVTVGGGEDGTTIIEAIIEMIVSIAGCREFDTVILAGPLVANARIRELTMRTAGLPVRIEHFVPDVSQLMQEADLVVSMGGYNSIAEILSHARRALIIPRESPRREQLMRATRLQELGLVQLLRQSDLTTTALWHAIRGAMRSQALPLAEARLHGTLPLDGATRIVSLLSSGARRRRQGIPKENTSE